MRRPAIRRLLHSLPRQPPDPNPRGSHNESRFRPLPTARSPPGCLRHRRRRRAVGRTRRPGRPPQQRQLRPGGLPGRRPRPGRLHRDLVRPLQGGRPDRREPGAGDGGPREDRQAGHRRVAGHPPRAGGQRCAPRPLLQGRQGAGPDRGCPRQRDLRRLPGGDDRRQVGVRRFPRVSRRRRVPPTLRGLTARRGPREGAPRAAGPARRTVRERSDAAVAHSALVQCAAERPDRSRADAGSDDLHRRPGRPGPVRRASGRPCRRSRGRQPAGPRWRVAVVGGADALTPTGRP